MCEDEVVWVIDAQDLRRNKVHVNSSLIGIALTKKAVYFVSLCQVRFL